MERGAGARADSNSNCTGKLGGIRFGENRRANTSLRFERSTRYGELQLKKKKKRQRRWEKKRKSVGFIGANAGESRE